MSAKSGIGKSKYSATTSMEIIIWWWWCSNLFQEMAVISQLQTDQLLSIETKNGNCMSRLSSLWNC